jgi:hypothetical protein
VKEQYEKKRQEELLEELNFYRQNVTAQVLNRFRAEKAPTQSTINVGISFLYLMVAVDNEIRLFLGVHLKIHQQPGEAALQHEEAEGVCGQ